MRYKVRKGLETPCKIRGLLSGDYWIFVGCCSSAGILLFLSARTGITTGNWSLTLLLSLVFLISLPLLLHILKKRSRQDKFKETKTEIHISNLDINSVLRKKKTE